VCWYSQQRAHAQVPTDVIVSIGGATPGATAPLSQVTNSLAEPKLLPWGWSCSNTQHLTPGPQSVAVFMTLGVKLPHRVSRLSLSLPLTSHDRERTMLKRGVCTPSLTHQLFMLNLHVTWDGRHPALHFQCTTLSSKIHSWP